MRAHAHDAIGVIAPPKRQSLQYVKVCSLYGAGFYYIPGTDTCIKVGGWVRAEINVNSNGSFSPIKGDLPSDTNRGVDMIKWRVRGVTTIDARSQTEYGTLRSYIAGGYQWDNGAGAAPGAGYIPRAFVQWAGITAGHAQSFFDFYSTPAYSNTTNVLGSDSGGSGENVFAYTAQFGNGLSASVAIEDNQYRRVGGIGGGYGGQYWPDFVGNLRIDQAWGSAQVMGAVHQLRSATAGIDDDVGYAFGGGVTVNLPMLGKGDSISTQVAYSKGALNYVGSGLGTFTVNTDHVTGTGLVGYGPANDAVLVGTGQDLTTGWSVVGGFQHSWNPNWKTSLYGTYGAISYSDAACAAMGGASGTCDWQFWQAGSRTIWTPVANLDLSVDVMYNHINTATNITPAGFAGNEDKGWWQGIFRIQRNFYP